MIDEQQQPLVSCVMPTYNRREFVPHAIRYFLRQDYENKELIIIDDGTDAIMDLIPDTPTIRYFRLDQKITLGAKLNLACTYATGNIIANWDDDDWYASWRLRYQIESLQDGKTNVCGINHLLYYDLRNKNAYQYIYPPDQRTWLLGSSLCYTKELWDSNQFAGINVGMDGLFVWNTPSDRITVLSDFTFSVHMIHNDNVSPKKTDGAWWNIYCVEKVREVMGNDWLIYNKEAAPHPKINGYHRQNALENGQPKLLKNVYVCLVHEHEDCVIDLVRNLHYHDPTSQIILYNGGENANLLPSHFPYDKFGAVLHPKPRPINYGYLHNFALDCMQFALENISFDTFTIVDSDQLSIRSGYSEYLRDFFSPLSLSDIGMLSSKPEQVKEDNKTNHVAIQAFKEYELWKPFLRGFSEGENKFVHWTFWPSTVFTKDATRDVVKLFKENKLLQEIIKQSRIWASEEVVLPTLVRLLGYEIVSNPCSYDFVKYRESYTIQDINDALNKTDAYWIHPIERKYECPHRTYIRQRYNNYSIRNTGDSAKNNSSINMFLTLPLLNRIREIEGWLSDQEADLLISTTLKACIELAPPHAIVEIGSYHGKSSVLFGSVAKAYFPQAKVYAIDPHEGVVGAVDQGLQSLPPSLERFKINIENAGLADVIELVKDYSYNVHLDTPISLLFIDGLHDYPNVSRDFWQFSGYVQLGGYIAFHDYAYYYPGVQAFVDELLGTGAYQKVQQTDSLMVVQKL